MAIYHCSIKIVKRSQGKSAVAAAAYRSGEKITNEYDGMVHDYTRKGGVVHSEILLPAHAPKSFRDRSTLWNSVEKIEKHCRAQLAREIEIALPNELNLVEQVNLVREYCNRTFVDAGMCADFNIHDPNKEQQNPHAHILLTMRPFNPDGSWGDKQKKEYVLDGKGNKIYDPKKRQYKCNTISTTDWNEQTKAEEWRQAWAEFANKALSDNHISETIDHRSYERQGVDQIPTVHMGVAATQMEQRGIATEKGNLNHMIREDNRLIRELKDKIASLTQWLDEITSQPQQPTLIEMLLQSDPTHDKQEAIAYMQSEQLATWEDLESHIKNLYSQAHDLNSSVTQSEQRMKVLRELLDAASVYQETRSVSDQYRRQKNPAKRQKFYDSHESELIRFEAAKKKLDNLITDHKLHVQEWRQEYSQLQAERDVAYSELKAIREKAKQVDRIRQQVYSVRRSLERNNNLGRQEAAL